MTRELLIGVAAAVVVTSPAFAQSPAAPATNTGQGAAPAPSGSFVTDSINATLEAGKITNPDSAIVGAASTGTGLRAPRSSIGTYNGATGPAYGAPGSTPYTGPGNAVSIPPGATPYTGPASLPKPVPAGAAPGG
jgi:hypothetical protein